MGKDGPLNLSRVRDALDHEDLAENLVEETAEDFENAFADRFENDVDVDAEINTNREMVTVEVWLEDDARPDGLTDELDVAQTRPMVFKIGTDVPPDGQTQRERIRGIKDIVADMEDDYTRGAPIEEVLDEAEWNGMEREKADHEIDKLKQKGEVYVVAEDYLRTI